LLGIAVNFKADLYKKLMEKLNSLKLN